MEITEIIKKGLGLALSELDIAFDGDIHLEHPKDLSHGDYATNIAMVLAKQLGQIHVSLQSKLLRSL